MIGKRASGELSVGECKELGPAQNHLLVWVRGLEGLTCLAREGRQRGAERAGGWH